MAASTGVRIDRRAFLATSAAALAAPALVRAEAARVLRFIPYLDVTVLDPHWSATYATRNHGYLVFDTLFGTDGAQAASPQMVETVGTEDGGRRWTLTLRSGQSFHDGEPVLARDCVASIRRWAQRDPFGQTLMAATDELSATDDRTLTFRLKRPFPLLPNALGKIPTAMPAIMPERLARTDAFTQIKEVVGSGPYRFKADERIAGHRTVYERFTGYRPREGGTPDWTAGPKIAQFDRVVWTVMPDTATAAGALQAGEQDWWEAAAVDLLPQLQRNRQIVLSELDSTGQYMILRLNHLQPPFSNPELRRALLGAVNQSDFVAAVAGTDPSRGRTGVGFFCPTSPMASGAGMEALTGPRELDRVRREIAEAGYKGERVVALAAGDNGENMRRMEVAADMMRKVGLTVDVQVSDWGTMMQRIFKKEPIEQGGWNCASYAVAGTDVWDPAMNNYLRSNGAGARAGWPSSPRLEALRDTWLEASDLATRQHLAAEMQVQAFRDVPYVPVGAYSISTAYRNDLTGLLQGFPIFWNVRRQV